MADELTRVVLAPLRKCVMLLYLSVLIIIRKEILGHTWKVFSNLLINIIFERYCVLAIFMLFSDVADSVTLGGPTETEEVSWKKRP